MPLSLVGNNTAKAGGLDVLDSLNSLDDLYGSCDLGGCFSTFNDMLICLSRGVFKDPDISSDEVVKIIQDAIFLDYACDENLMFVVLKKCFERFPNLINVGYINLGLYMNALYLAVTHNNVEMVNWLLDHGAVWVMTTEDGKYVKNGEYLYTYAYKRAKETGERDVLDRLLAQDRDKYGYGEPMDLAQINPPAFARPMPQPKTGLKARFRKMLGCFGSR